MGKTSNAAKDRWKAKSYDSFLTYIPKGKRAELQAWCAANSTSLGGLVKKLLEERTGIKLTGETE